MRVGCCCWCDDIVRGGLGRAGVCQDSASEVKCRCELLCLAAGSDVEYGGTNGLPGHGVEYMNGRRIGLSDDQVAICELQGGLHCGRGKQCCLILGCYDRQSRGLDDEL